jgi:hypothetical protein
MASCKTCSQQIVWYKDELSDRWVPLEPGTDKRHDCSGYRGRRYERPDPYRRGYQDGYSEATHKHAYDYARGRRDGYAEAAGLDRKFLMDLVRFTHPDKHPRERFTEANKLTAKLNALLDEIGRQKEGQ